MRQSKTSLFLSRWRSAPARMLALVLCCGPAAASAAPVTYNFDYEITFDYYRGALTGPLLALGTHGTGTATFEYQPSAQGDGWSTSYASLPFSVKLGAGSNYLTLIDSSLSDSNYRSGIIVQDTPSNYSVYDTILFEGLSGPVETVDAYGNPVVRHFYSQLGLFSLSNLITNTDLSAQNISAVAGNLIATTFEIRSASYTEYGQVNGAISNFRLASEVAAVPEPGTFALLGIGVFCLSNAQRRRRSTMT